MSATAATNTLPPSDPPKSKRKGKKRKGSTATNGDGPHAARVNGSTGSPREANEDAGEDADGSHPSSPQVVGSEPGPRRELTGSQKPAARDRSDHDAPDEDLPVRTRGEQPPVTNGSIAPDEPDPTPDDATDATDRFDALAKERDSLRAEVVQLRKALEGVQGTPNTETGDARDEHETKVAALEEQLHESRAGRDHWEAQYKTLLGRVNTIRSQLGERLKTDAEHLSQARSQIDELEATNRGLEESDTALRAEVAELTSQRQRQSQEIAELRGRATLSQQNWVQERDELITREAYAREEFENAKQAMQDWEVLAMEERSMRESLRDRVAEVEERLESQTEAYERAASDRDGLSQTVDGLQRALQEIQDARKRELREMVENSQSQLEDLRRQLKEAEDRAHAAQATLEITRTELERALPFEKEVREKNLAIGTLRREGAILNDHLNRALRSTRKSKSADNVDRQIVTNHLLHFLALDRADPKKFQVLQLIAMLLGWSDEQREQAGLARPGAPSSSLRVPLSPFRRTPSTSSLGVDLTAPDAGHSKESLAELWSEFLEREAQEASGGDSRRGSAISPPSAGGSGLGLSGLRDDGGAPG